jgi:D-alanine-D-alanine ligase
VNTEAELRDKCAAVIREFGAALIEEFIPGTEFTVLVAARPDDPFAPLVLQPLEFVFPPGERFKTYTLKVEQHHPARNVPVANAEIEARLRQAARDIFVGFQGEGYARLDFRLNEAGQLFFLDINFACSLFYPEGYEGSADYILKHDPMHQSGFLQHIIEEGIQRHRKKRKKYERRGNAISGFGIFATEAIPAGHIVFRGEERAHRVVTLGHVERNWPLAQVELFRRYAMPAGGQVYLLWDEKPEDWAPQNHSCNPNTAMAGLNLVASRDVKAGEELTIDYATICDEQMTPFLCTCGFPQCRKYVRGAAGSSAAWQRGRAHSRRPK